MQHSWFASGPGAHFCARCGLETKDDARAAAPAECTPPPLAMCKHAPELEAQKLPPFGVVIVAALPRPGHEGARFEINCCRRCWLAVTSLVADLELKP